MNDIVAGTRAPRSRRRRCAAVRAVTSFCIFILLAVGCTTGHSEGSFLSPSTAGQPSPPATSPATTSPPATSPPATSKASSTCSLVSTAQVTGLLHAGPLQVQGHEAGCNWFASDSSVNAFVGVDCQSSAVAASKTFQSEQQFTPGQQPFTFADRAYSASSPLRAGGSGIHATASVLSGPAIFISTVDVMATADAAVTAAKTIVEAAYRTFTSGFRCP